jgi:hypothetical protein
MERGERSLETSGSLGAEAMMDNLAEGGSEDSICFELGIVERG